MKFYDNNFMIIIFW